MLRVPKSQRKRLNKVLTFPYAIRSFLGHLEGTRKSLHTIKNYRLDLLSFQEFLEKASGSKPIPLQEVSSGVLENFHRHLKGKGLKTNTRRRKLLTVRKFLLYLSRRRKLSEEVGKKLPTPHKVERVPYVVPLDDLIRSVAALPSGSILEQRNRVMLWVLAETGCLVSEVTQLRFEDFFRQDRSAWIQIRGKAPRAIPVSRDLIDAVGELNCGEQRDVGWVFLGFNKFGSLGAAISSRGVEILVKMLGPRLGFPALTPRTFRHSAAVYWFRQGNPRDEIQKRLGLKTAYAFRSYEPLFKSRTETTSTSETHLTLS